MVDFIREAAGIRSLIFRPPSVTLWAQFENIGLFSRTAAGAVRSAGFSSAFKDLSGKLLAWRRELRLQISSQYGMRIKPALRPAPFLAL